MDRATRLLIQARFELLGIKRISFKPLLGGLTNLNYLVKDLTTEKEYVYKGRNVTFMEMLITSLAVQAKLCPNLISVDKHFIIEEFNKSGNYTPLEYIQNIDATILGIKKLHSFPYSRIGENCVWDNMLEWYDLYGRATTRAKCFIADRWFRGADLTKYKCSISHNDMHFGNVLKDGIFIDYEVACINYEIYDWANMANEVEFVLDENSYKYVENKAVVEKLRESADCTTEEFQYFRNMSHQYWGLWAMMMHCKKLGDPNFDYLSYSDLRFDSIVIGIGVFI